jgi:hypothetical protein
MEVTQCFLPSLLLAVAVVAAQRMQVRVQGKAAVPVVVVALAKVEQVALAELETHLQLLHHKETMAVMETAVAMRFCKLAVAAVLLLLGVMVALLSVG